jgi:hypothetical protein
MLVSTDLCRCLSSLHLVQDLTFVHAHLDAYTKHQEYTFLRAHVDGLAGTDKRLQQQVSDAAKMFIAARQRVEQLEQDARKGCLREEFEACRDWMPDDITIEAATALFDEVSKVALERFHRLSMCDHFSHCVLPSILCLLVLPSVQSVSRSRHR